MLERSRMLGLVAAVAAAYAVLWVVGQGPLEHVYTAEWVSRRLPWFFAPVTVLLAVLSRRVAPATISVLGCVLGVTIGELIGGRVWAARTARLERELSAGGPQTWEAEHPGWWIAILVFVATTLVGALLARRATSRATSRATER